MGEADPFDHFEEGGLAAEVEGAVGGGLGDGGGEGLIVLVAEDGKASIWIFGGHLLEDGGEIFVGPAFVVPAGTG